MESWKRSPGDATRVKMLCVWDSPLDPFRESLNYHFWGNQTIQIPYNNALLGLVI